MKRLVIVLLLIATISGCSKVEEVPTVTGTPVVDVMPEPTTTTTVEVLESEPKKITFRVTAYCPCEKCCGEWAKKRPLNEDGEPIVYGAWGKELTDGYSVASPIDFGTQIELEGIGLVEVQDRTATWVVDKYGDNIIDIYMTDHEAAKKFGVQYIEGVVK